MNTSSSVPWCVMTLGSPSVAMSAFGVSSAITLAVIDDGHAVAQPLGFVHVVRGQQDGAALGAEAVEDVPQLPPRLRIEAGRRLVEEQQVGVAGQRAGHRQALLLPARQLADPAACACSRAPRCASSSSTVAAAAGRTIGTAAASPRPSACRPAASPAAGCRAAAAARARRAPSAGRALPRRRRRARAALRGSRWWWSCRRRWGRAGRSIRRGAPPATARPRRRRRRSACGCPVH